MEITKEIFDEQRHPRFGSANPERMHLAFWEWMIRGGDRNPAEDESAQGIIMREGKLKSSYGPYRARDLFNVPLNREDGPIWTFDRMGATRTQLPDGRHVFVGGEHEDSYDPDFCIYNDVVVFGPAGEIAIFGYPQARRPRHTPLYALELQDFRFSEIETQGEAPGWIFHHEAEFDPEGIITIRGGETFDEIDSKEHYRRNVEEYALDLRSNQWRSLTNRNWPQFGIRMEDGKFFGLNMRPKPEALLPKSVNPAIVPCDKRNCVKFMVAGVPVSLTVNIMRIDILIEGELPEALISQITEEIRANAERYVKSPCFQEQV